MPKLWTLGPNGHEDWDLTHIYVERGKLNINDWHSHMVDKKMLTYHEIPEYDTFETNDQSGNTVSTINTVSKCLNYQEDQHINTVELYVHSDYVICAMYINDYDAMSGVPINYYGTIINKERLQIYGPMVIFKIANGLTVDTELSELLYLLSNFYYVQCIKLNDNMFEEIAVNNYEPEMDRMFKTYHRKCVSSWIVLSENKETLKKLEPSNNEVSKFNGLIWVKYKQYKGDVSNFHNTCENNRGSDLRGLYENIDDKYVQRVFFNL
jgi:hypothetical protein